jgi:hypothetical protein
MGWCHGAMFTVTPHPAKIKQEGRRKGVCAFC